MSIPSHARARRSVERSRRRPLLFERRPRIDLVTESIFERRVLLGCRGQIRGGSLLRVSMCGLGLGQSGRDLVASGGHLRHSVAEFPLTPRQPFGCRGQVGFGALLRGTMCSLGLNQSVLDRGACRECIRQRCAQSQSRAAPTVRPRLSLRAASRVWLARAPRRHHAIAGRVTRSARSTRRIASGDPRVGW